jgi:protein O-mannosyl-transferase
LWLAAVAICYLFAFGSKEQAIIFPLNLLAFDYIFNRFKNLNNSFSIFKSRVVLEKIPFFILALLLYLFSAANNLGTFGITTYPFYQRLLFAMSSFMDYIFRFIAPVKLYYFYFFPIEIGEAIPKYYLSYPILIIICAAFLWFNYKKNNKLVIFGFLLFIINILLVLHIIPMPRKMITADRYMYFSIIGLATIMAWFAQYLYAKLKTRRKILSSALFVWLIFLGVHTYIRTTEWKDSDSIKRNINELIEKRKANNEPVVNDPINHERDETK